MQDRIFSSGKISPIVPVDEKSISLVLILFGFSSSIFCFAVSLADCTSAIFFKDPFLAYSSVSTEHLESSLNLYDSLLVSLKKPVYLSQAYYRLGDIHY